MLGGGPSYSLTLKSTGDARRPKVRVYAEGGATVWGTWAVLDHRKSTLARGSRWTIGSPR